jgi:hypothetical protein
MAQPVSEEKTVSQLSVLAWEMLRPDPTFCGQATGARWRCKGEEKKAHPDQKGFFRNRLGAWAIIRYRGHVFPGKLFVRPRIKAGDFSHK